MLELNLELFIDFIKLDLSQSIISKNGFKNPSQLFDFSYWLIRESFPTFSIPMPDSKDFIAIKIEIPAKSANSMFSTSSCLQDICTM